MRAVVSISLLAGGCGDGLGPVDAAPSDVRSLGALDGECLGSPGRPRVLVYTFENLWRHLSNYTARLALYDLCRTHGFTVRTTNDPRAINATRLADADVVVFSVTSGSGLDDASKADFERWFRDGGGVVGFEAAAATEQEWPFYVELLGARFRAHPPGVQQATVRIDTGHAITSGLPADLTLTEQWYTFHERPEDVPGLTVLMTLDEATLVPDVAAEFKVGYHAIGWAHEPAGGRVFYTGLGDLPSTFQDPLVLQLTVRAIEWAAGGI